MVEWGVLEIVINANGIEKRLPPQTMASDLRGVGVFLSCIT